MLCHCLASRACISTGTFFALLQKFKVLTTLFDCQLECEPIWPGRIACYMLQSHFNVPLPWGLSFVFTDVSGMFDCEAILEAQLYLHGNIIH